MKMPDMLWSPVFGLFMKERGWWLRMMTANGVRLGGAEWVNELPTDVVRVVTEPPK